jgi:hypothetical protein
VVIIECTVRCAAPPEVQWYKEKTAVRQDTRRTVNVQQVTKVSQKHPDPATYVNLCVGNAIYVLGMSFQGEYKVQLEINQVTTEDKGSYKVVTKNEKGETTSQSVDVTEIPEEEEKPKDKPKEKAKGDAPKFAQGLKSSVRL